jgi:hypothetical protein
VDEQSSSGSYYPYSSGTAGDDPSKPTSTSASPDAKSDGDTSGATGDWMESADSDGDGYLSRSELTKFAPTRAASFEAMDVDRDGKLTRDELRNWNESHKARMDADQGATPSTSKSDTTNPTSPTDDTKPSSNPPDDGN